MQPRRSPLRRLSFALALALAASTASAAEESPNAQRTVILDDDPAPVLGMSLVDAFARFGPPSSVGAVRGEAAWQDDIAFIYPDGYTLFLYGDRIWQLRFTKPYGGSLYGLFIGDESGKALSILGQPYESGSGFLIYRMPYKSYPVRLRLALQEDRIADAYLFRADF